MRIEKKLFELEIGSESMFISTQAMFALLNEFGVDADVMLGHSSGENSALVAAGMVRLGDRGKMREHILRLNEMYQEIDAAGDVTTGSLLTVGAVDRDIVIRPFSSGNRALRAVRRWLVDDLRSGKARSAGRPC